MSFTLAIVLLVGLVYPGCIILTHKKTNNLIMQNVEYRIIDYKRTIIIFWSLALLIFLNYLMSNPPVFSLASGFTVFSYILFSLAATFLFIQYKSMKVALGTANTLKEKLKGIYHYLPKSRKELCWFVLLSASAGFCEEIIFRVFLFGYLDQYVNLISAIIISNIIFALTHTGSGIKNILSSFLLGVVFSTIYCFTGNIWIVVVLHTGIDMNTGLLGYRLNLEDKIEIKKEGR